MQRAALLAMMAAMQPRAISRSNSNPSLMPGRGSPATGRHMSNNKYGHLTWKESRPENTELRHRNEAERARAREARTA